MYSSEDIVMNIIMCCRVSTPEAIEFRSKLGFKQHNIILSKEQLMTSKIKKIFSNKNNVLDCKIDIYFSEHKLTIEGDEKGHTEKDKIKKQKNKKQQKKPWLYIYQS